MLARNVAYGETVSLREESGREIGCFRIEKRESGMGTGVRVVFDMPRSTVIRILNHRANGIAFGLSGQAQGPLKAIAN